MTNTYLEEQKRIEQENRKIVRNLIASRKVLTTEDLPDYEGCKIRISRHSKHNRNCYWKVATDDIIEISYRKKITSIKMAIRTLLGHRLPIFHRVYNYIRCNITDEKIACIKIFTASTGGSLRFIVGLSGEKLTAEFMEIAAFKISGKEIIVGSIGTADFLLRKNGEPIENASFVFNENGNHFLGNVLYNLLDSKQE